MLGILRGFDAPEILMLVSATAVVVFCVVYFF
jgi:hypothetical protein